MLIPHTLERQVKKKGKKDKPRNTLPKDVTRGHGESAKKSWPKDQDGQTGGQVS